MQSNSYHPKSKVGCLIDSISVEPSSWRSTRLLSSKKCWLLDWPEVSVCQDKAEDLPTIFPSCQKREPKTQHSYSATGFSSGEASVSYWGSLTGWAYWQLWRAMANLQIHSIQHSKSSLRYRERQTKRLVWWQQYSDTASLKGSAPIIAGCYSNVVGNSCETTYTDCMYNQRWTTMKNKGRIVFLISNCGCLS